MRKVGLVLAGAAMMVVVLLSAALVDNSLVTIVGISAPKAVQQPSPPAPDPAIEAAMREIDLSVKSAKKEVSYYRWCPNKESKNGRPRICDEYFILAFARNDTRPHQAFYFHKRLDQVIKNSEQGFLEARERYVICVILIASLGLIAAVAIAFRRENPTWFQFIFAIGVLVVAIATALGWSDQYKATYRQWNELTDLRDEVEINVVRAQSDPDLELPLDAWLKRYTDIRTKQTTESMKSVNFPNFSRLVPTGSSGTD